MPKTGQFRNRYRTPLPDFLRQCGRREDTLKTIAPVPEKMYTDCVNEVAILLNGMVDAGVIKDYAMFGAVAQMRYTEAVATLDADILVVVPEPEVLDLLSPIYRFCRERGYEPEGEAIRVGDWPVQFIPAFSPLTEAAIQHAETGDVDGARLRVVRADYLAVIALSVGRAKDFARILALREADAITDDAIYLLAAKYDLLPAWTTFRKRFDET